MKIGIPKECKPRETRVGLPPSAIYTLIQRGHEVTVQYDAGEACGFSNEEYQRSGARMVQSLGEVYENGDLIVKVKEPQPEEFDLLHDNHTLFTYLHLAATREVTEALLSAGVTAIAYENVEQKGRHPLLDPMSEIAGRMSVLMGAFYLGRNNGGSGTLLGGVPGVLPGRVVVLGGGTAGVNAARMAIGLGADVTILEVDVERMRFLDITMHTAHTLYSNESHLMELLPHVDLLIGAVLLPGRRAPKLVTREMLRKMRAGSVFVDIAIDQGGCAETSRPTTHDDPVFVEEGVVHYCVANMPAAYSRTSAQALTNVTFPYVEILADHDLPEALRKSPALLAGLAVWKGELVSQAVAEAHDLPWKDPEEI